MSEITRVGVDLAKQVIQVHAVDAAGQRVTSRALPRAKFVAWCAQLPPGCMVAMEASASAHHWARRLVSMGLDARIMAAHLVAPYRLQGRSGKTDADDAAAVCEAASRPTMHFVPVKSVEQQSLLCIHRLREGFKAERTACINRMPRAAGRVRTGVRTEAGRAARGAARCDGRRKQRVGNPGPAGAATRLGPVA